MISTILFAKQHLSSFSSTDIQLMAEYYELGDFTGNRNDLLWLLTLKLHDGLYRASMHPTKVLYNTQNTGIEYRKKLLQTSFKNNLDIIFNLYLVLRGGRRAYLFESANIGSLRQALDIIAEIKSTFPELKITLENTEANRYLIYKDEQLEKDIIENSGDDNWLGKVLGFDCPGDFMNRNMIRYGVDYYVNGENFYAEVCTNPPKLSKLDIWRPFATELEYNLTGEITEIVSDAYWFSIIDDQDFDKIRQKKPALIEWLEGYGHGAVSKLLQDSDDIESIHGYLLASIHLIKYKIFYILYPLTVDQANIFEKQDYDLLRDPTTTPQNYIRRLIDTAVKDIATAEELKIIKDSYNQMS